MTGEPNPSSYRDFFVGLDAKVPLLDGTLRNLHQPG